MARKSAARSAASKARGKKHVGFAKLKGKLARKGVRNPGGLAAAIGRKKYGKAGMAALSAAGKRKAAKRRK